MIYIFGVTFLRIEGWNVSFGRPVHPHSPPPVKGSVPRVSTNVGGGACDSELKASAGIITGRE